MKDGKDEKLVNNASVLVEGNLIKQVSVKAIKADGATVIDGKWRTLMPRLITEMAGTVSKRPSGAEICVEPRTFQCDNRLARSGPHRLLPVFIQ